jgi:hypothetical protein
MDRVETWVHYRAAVHALREVVEALREAHVEVLPVKGIVTAHWLYDDIADRPMSDVDLRVRPRDFRRALAVGRKRGWLRVHHTPRFWDAAFVVNDILIELEGTIGPPGLCALGVDELFSRATVRTAPLGFEHFEPEEYDHAVVLCLNAFKDRLDGLTPWALRDLERLPRVELDPRTMASRCIRARVATPVWIVSDWLARARGVEWWSEVRDALGPRPSRPVYERLYARSRARRMHPVGALLLTSAGADGFPRAAAAVGLAVAGWAYGGVMRRVLGVYA